MLKSQADRRLVRLRRGTAEINVVPFVDIVLVLLVVFMVGAPLATQGVSVNLPVTRPSNLAVADEAPLVVTVNEEGQYSLADAGEDRGEKDLEQIVRHLRALVRRGPQPAVVVRADSRVSYDRVALLLTEIRAAGVSRVGLITRLEGSGRGDGQ